MSLDLSGMFETLAEHGTAPEEGCSQFGVGYESEFERLRATYIVDRFNRGGSGEKFIVGAFGSGKTHFLRQLMEIGRAESCVTVEVKLNKKLDFTQGLVLYQEIAQQIRAPGAALRGLRNLVIEAVRRERDQATAMGFPADDFVRRWVDALDSLDFPSASFGRVMRRGLDDYLTGEMAGFESAMRWLSGDVEDKKLARQVGESALSKSELAIHAHNATLSLYKFVNHTPFRGTIVGYDEAEEGIAVERRKMAKIFSYLLAEVNAISDLKNGSVMIVYAVTPDIRDKINQQMPMLHQRLADPGNDNGFFDGNVFAPCIDLTRRPDAAGQLEKIGRRLVELFFDGVPGALKEKREEALGSVQTVAEQVAFEDQSSGVRRVMVRRICTDLVNNYRESGARGRTTQPPLYEAEV